MTLTLTPDATPPAEALRESLPRLRGLRGLADQLRRETRGLEESASWHFAAVEFDKVCQQVAAALRARDARAGGEK